MHIDTPLLLQRAAGPYADAEVGANADALDRVMRLLGSHGVFRRVGRKYGQPGCSLVQDGGSRT
ncbi:MAG: hypothetical protein DMG89_09910 [Acidobacteria bacterium]|nr:MAG: hypothetical protein DMG89_09910 [Acidobacteriota bacterium]